jgi:hypothetical protein
VFSSYLPSPHDPFRPPQRRLLRCRYLLEHGRRPHPRLDDPQTRTAFQFLRAYQRCRDEDARRRVARQRPALAEAHAFYSTATSLARSEVEARLLAGAGDDAVAGRCGLSAAAVAWFHDLFFDVRPYLKARDYIVNVVIGPKAHADLSEDDAETLLRLFAYLGGTHVLDSLIDYFRAPEPIPDDVSLVPPDRRARAALHLLIRAALAAGLAPSGDPRVGRFALLAEQLGALRHGATEPAEPAVIDLQGAAGPCEGTGETKRRAEGRPRLKRRSRPRRAAAGAAAVSPSAHAGAPGRRRRAGDEVEQGDDSFTTGGEGSR